MMGLISVGASSLQRGGIIIPWYLFQIRIRLMMAHIQGSLALSTKPPATALLEQSISTSGLRVSDPVGMLQDSYRLQMPEYSVSEGTVLGRQAKPKYVWSGKMNRHRGNNRRCWTTLLLSVSILSA